MNKFKIGDNVKITKISAASSEIFVIGSLFTAYAENAKTGKTELMDFAELKTIDDEFHGNCCIKYLEKTKRRND